MLNHIDVTSYTQQYGLVHPTDNITHLLTAIADQCFPLSKRENENENVNEIEIEKVKGNENENGNGNGNENENGNGREKFGTEDHDRVRVSQLRMARARDAFLDAFQCGKLGRHTLDDLSIVGNL
jgi:hypothetical protein